MRNFWLPTTFGFDPILFSFDNQIERKDVLCINSNRIGKFFTNY